MNTAAQASSGRPAARRLRVPRRREAAPWTAVNAGNWHRRDEAVMGTAIHVELWCEDAALGERACDAVIDEMHRIDRAMSPHKPGSELSRLNREAAAGPFELSEEMARLIGRALDFSALSEGAFDISYAGVGQLYDYRAGVRPSDAQIESLRPAIGWRHLQLDRAARRLRFAREGVRIDLGGFAKGHAVDNAAAILRGLGIRHAMVSAGGDSRVIGDRLGRPWSVAIRDPRDASGLIAVLPLVDTSISTSGDYERAFMHDGERCHHLIDPATGRSPQGIASVTVIAPDGLTSEALSKSVFVLGVERGLALVDRLDGVEAVVVDAGRRLHFSAGLQPAGAEAPR